MDVLIVANSSPPVKEVAEVFHGSVHTATKAVCTVLVLFVLLLGCFGNALVFLSASELKKLRSNFDVFILNLAMADFLMCSCLSPVFLYVLFAEPPYPRVFCSSFLFLGSACGLLSLLTLVSIALHRQARVVGQTKGALTSCQAGVALGFIWTTSIVLALGGTIHVTLSWPETQTSCQMIVNSHDRLVYNFVLFFIAPVSVLSFIIIAMAYTVIAWAVHSQSKTCRPVQGQTTKPTRRDVQQRQPPNCSGNARDMKAKQISPNGKHGAAGQSQLDKENKAMTMCFVVTLTIILCWGPLVISQFVELLVGESIILYQVKICGIALVFLNSALDPYIYAQYSSKTKQRYLKCFKRLLTFECKKNGNRTRLQNTVNASLSAIKQKSSNNDQETNTVHLASPKLHRKVFIDRSAGPGVPLSYRTVLVSSHLVHPCSKQHMKSKSSFAIQGCSAQKCHSHIESCKQMNCKQTARSCPCASLPHSSFSPQPKQMYSVLQT